MAAVLSSDEAHAKLYILNDDDSITVVNTSSKAVAANETISVSGELITLDADGTFTLTEALGFNADFDFSELKLTQVGGSDRLILGSNHMKGLVSLAL